MNERPLRNLCKVAACWLLHVSGITGCLIRRFGRPSLLVVNYHDFTTFRNSYWRFGSLSESAYGRGFDRQMRFLAEHFRPAGEEDLSFPGGHGPCCLVTFDDGYADNFEIALEVLARRRMSAVFFVATAVAGRTAVLWADRVRARFAGLEVRSWLGGLRAKRALKHWLKRVKTGSPRGLPPQCGAGLAGRTGQMMMTWEELGKALALGVSVGAHTRTHPILSGLGEDSQRMEIEGSIRDVESHLGKRPVLFAYPEGGAGSFDETTKEILRSAGIRAAFTTVAGVNEEGCDLLELKRIGVNPSDPLPVFAAKIAWTYWRTTRAAMPRARAAWPAGSGG